jgi:hypothetical protein
MMAAGIRRQRLSARDWGIKALLDEFAAACAQVRRLFLLKRQQTALTRWPAPAWLRRWRACSLAALVLLPWLRPARLQLRQRTSQPCCPPQVHFKPPLTAREAQFLQDISADRPPGY